jgi:hypothetical protein
MEIGADILDHFVLRSGIHPAFCHLAGTPINDFVPECLGIIVHALVQAGDELANQECEILFRQGQHFGDLFSSNAHPAENIGQSERADKFVTFHNKVESSPREYYADSIRQTGLRLQPTAEQLARKREDRRDDESRCIEESHGNGGPCGEHFIEFVTADVRVHGFARSQLMSYTLEQIVESERKADAPQDRLQLFFSTHDVTLSGWRCSPHGPHAIFSACSGMAKSLPSKPALPVTPISAAMLPTSPR